MNITVHKPSLRLAGLYLGIIMFISLFFSANVYQLSLQEFGRGFQGLSAKGVNIEPGSGFVALLEEKLQHERMKRYEEAKLRVLTRLVLINGVILVGGGFLSYYLARRTLQPIEEAHEAQSRFTADASHELRTPIAAMQSETEVALMDPKLTLAQAKQRLESNLEELGKLTTLSEGLLRLAQLDNSDLQQRTVPVDHVVQQALDRVMPLAEKKQILITSAGRKGLKVQGDEVSLTEALVILLDNAVKYSPEKTEVHIGTASAQKQVSITVQDHGAGIKATALPHIFDRFYRADTARSKQHANGYGLGLAIAKNIVDLHGGRITAQSKPGQGSAFGIHLPAKGQQQS
jgi:two-component system, OmpR family, sensor histidine kinase CiaH